MTNIHSVTRSDLIKNLSYTEELKDIKTVWFMQALAYDSFSECMQNAGKAIISPPMDKKTLGDVGYAAKLKFVGISLDVLLQHNYDCKDDGE